MKRLARGRQVLRSLLAPLRGDAEHLLQKKIFRVASRSFSLRQNRFPHAVILPRSFGRGLPERVVELLLVRLTYAPGKRILDVGHSNIMECHKRLLLSLRKPRHVTGLDIAAPTYVTTRFYESSVRGDIIHPPFPEQSFDIVWCISTLEHVGMDNSGYTQNYELDEGADRRAVEALARLVARDGCLLITVPFGRWEHHGWFRNYDRDRWNEVLTGLRGRGEVIELFFCHDGDRGWIPTDPSTLSDVGYFSQSNAGAAGLAAVLYFNRPPAGRGSAG
jgi:SAM-dependent methyltransferase